ncbi:ureidoglycolate lyase [Geitlerinema sp. PCC 7407]|uniref:ureidoglycolate lyase n=1 Tax=Geitlerinema sp. PCC 7407 TaxID=1173025 RepID=UPI00029F8D20|nr:ureidoglycolate lyase [Geitlerinema sp. PCC 7407]AFY64749.1 hypothetical protein GEI7407_0244 [Geitlerinema sp. PCC 7407]
MTASASVRSLVPQSITAAAFEPYGQVLWPSEDGAPYGPGDAQLELSAGIPRFYLMRLPSPGLQFHTITRHQRCTQCLGSLADKDWLMAVAPPSADPHPDLEAIAAFHIPGNCFIKLHVGTWHAGPYFSHDFVDFYNLELSDTNLTDHDTWDLQHQDQMHFQFILS